MFMSEILQDIEILEASASITTRWDAFINSRLFFFMGRFVTLMALTTGWSRYFRHLRGRRKYLGGEDPNYTYFRNRGNAYVGPNFLLPKPEMDINHLSNDYLRFNFVPYPYIARDDYRPGESEWSYHDIEAPSSMGTLSRVYIKPSKESAEFEYFKKAMMMCGRFQISHLRRLFAHCQILEMEPNEVLFEVGDPDDFLYIVIKGQLQVMHVDEYKCAKRLRTAQRGDRILSMFSFVDVLTGNSKPLKTVEAYAMEKSRVVKFPVPALREYLLMHENKIPDVISRLIRRIYEMNYIMLHRILGLSLIALSDPIDPRLLLRTESYVETENDHDPYVIPDPDPGTPISDELRSDAVKSFLNYLGVPQNSSVLDDALIFILDPDEKPKEEVLTGHPIVDNDNIKFKYLFKGCVELYRVQDTKFKFRGTEGEHVRQPTSTHETLYRLYPGEGVGGLATFADIPNFLFVRIVRRSIIVATTVEINRRLFERHPIAILPMANQIIKRLSPTIRRIDFGVEWVLAEGGKSLFVTGSEVQDTFVVLGGRLRSYMSDAKGHLSYYGEYEKYDWIGLVETLVRFPIRSKSVIAVRETELCKIPVDFISFLKQSYPVAANSLLGYIAKRVVKKRFFINSPKISLDPELQLVAGTSRRCASIGLLPTSENVPYMSFAKEIKKHHDMFGTTTILSWTTMQEELGFTRLEYTKEFEVEALVMAALSQFDLVVFVCSHEVLIWTEICIRHSEIIFSLGTQNYPVSVNIMERMLVTKQIGDRKRKELIILHKEEVDQREDHYQLPFDTICWLELRPWISCHHHLRIPAEAFKFPGARSTAQLDEEYSALTRPIHKYSDLSRFNRWLMGKSVGIVFTGGGARMAVQAGVFKAVADEGIPIDMVGGVGQGYILGALYAVYGDVWKVVEYAEEIFREIRNSSFTMFDITIPWISPCQGRNLLAMVMKFFAKTRMEDTWIPNFCLLCDISRQDFRVVRDGPFWTYARGSLSNFYDAPPINDPKDGGYIVDGSFANPVPEDIMRKFGAEYVLVINTTDGKTFEAKRFDFSKDLWTNLWRLFLVVASRLNPKTPDIVRVNEAINRTQKVMYTEAVEAQTGDLYVAFIKPKSEACIAQHYRNFNRMLYMGNSYAHTIFKMCPMKGVPFHKFWANLRKNSARFESEHGRGIRHNVNEDFWDSIQARLFERDEQMQKLRLSQLKGKYGGAVKANMNPEEMKLLNRPLEFQRAFRHTVLQEFFKQDNKHVEVKEEEHNDI